MKKGQLKYHFLLLVIIVFMDFFGDYVYGGQKQFLGNFKYPHFLHVICFHATFISVYVLNYSILCPLTLSRKQIIRFLLGVVALFFVYAGIRYLCEEVIVYSITGRHNYSEQSRRFWYYIFDNTYFAIKAILFSTSIYLLFQYNNHKTKMHQLELEHKKSELDFLKSQIGPHFLFNTLNTFYAELMDKQPETAKDIHKLSELLRYVIYEAQEDAVSIDKELKFVEEYIYFFRKRFEDQLFLDYSVEGEVQDQKIPSLILIHFVENLFKHGVVTDPNRAARIEISLEQNHFVLQTENRTAPSEKHMEGGIGVNSVKRRLDALFGEKYTLYHHREAESFKVELTCPYV